jgi:hypothetical protein
MADGPGRILWHGTTRKRAEAILRDGPNPSFREPEEIYTRAECFSTAFPEVGVIPGSPQDYALRKAALFPEEGGAVVLEIEVPQEIFDRAYAPGKEFRFLPGWGLEELLEAWPSLPKRILPC